MKRAALGFRVHSGWTALVAISLEHGFPQVLLRQRPHLVPIFTFEFRQPYHTAEKGPASEARRFISQARANARRLAYQSIHSVQTCLREKDYEINSCGLLLASGRPLPALSQILASHALIHTADGELFREALTHATTRFGFKMFAIKERELLDECSIDFQLEHDELLRRVASLGSALGPPWSQDEKYSALVAWLSLVK